MPLSPHVPDLGAMDVLLSVARLGSLGKAAEEEHGVTQPAVSSRISRMERLLGVALIERSAQGSTLTPAGSLVADWAREVVEAASSLERGVEALRSESHDRLQLVSSMTIAEYLMPSWLVTAHQEDPDLGIALELANSSEVARRVADGLADLGFVEGPTRPRGLRTETVGRDRLVVVVARSHPWSRRTGRLGPDELAQTPLIQRERGSGTRSTLDRALISTLGEVETAPAAARADLDHGDQVGRRQRPGPGRDQLHRGGRRARARTPARGAGQRPRPQPHPARRVAGGDLAAGPLAHLRGPRPARVRRPRREAGLTPRTRGPAPASTCRRWS